VVEREDGIARGERIVRAPDPSRAIRHAVPCGHRDIVMGGLGQVEPTQT
jgi:hypothetical protein